MGRYLRYEVSLAIYAFYRRRYPTMQLLMARAVLLGMSSYRATNLSAGDLVSFIYHTEVFSIPTQV